MSRKKLPLSYFRQDDVVFLARDLLGKILCTNINGQFTSGIITETEAYSGRGDKACHSYGGRKTKRTSVMYDEGGLAYVYLCYGIHHLFNIVTNVHGLADAILIRAIEPLEGLEIIRQRRRMDKVQPKISSGPGSASQALGISTSHYGENLSGEEIWVEEGKFIKDSEIVATTRIGIDYAGDDALLPWRFYIRNNPFISKK